MMESIPPNHRFVTTDLDEQEQTNVAAATIQLMGDLLESASAGLSELEQNHMLGSAIVRKCQELADVVGRLSQEMASHSKEKRHELARACLQDAVEAARAQAGHELALYNKTDDVMEANQQQEDNMPVQCWKQMSSMSEDDMAEALSGVELLLKDVEGALRSVGQDEADEIADAALIAARLFIHMLQSSYKALLVKALPENEMNDRIVLLQNGDEDVTFADEATTRSRSRETAAPISNNDNNNDRVRALWPPLGPAVGSALHWGKDAALQQPVLAVALGLVLWPAALVTACLSTPLLVADGVLQHFYNKLQDGPLIQTLEHGAAQVYQTTKLAVLVSGLVGRHVYRVARRQLDRHGGAEQVAHHAVGFCVDRVTHPVDTVQQAIHGVAWAFSATRDAALTIHGVVSQEMEKEMDKTCQTALQ